MNPVKFYTQDITYWGPGANNRFGHQQSAAPILIKGRWEDKIEQVRRPDGEEVTSTARVFVDRAVGVSGFLGLGDFTTQATPPNTAREIQSVTDVPDLRNLEQQRVAYL